MDKIYSKLTLFLGSKVFFGFIIFFFIVQAFWLAASFKLLPYDEIFHYSVIQLFSQQLYPFISNQPVGYDHLGNLSNGPATLYHYLMSFIVRILEVFSFPHDIKITALRTVNIIFASIGIIIYAHLFRRVGFKQIFINIAFLFYVLIPIVPLTAATINYDNLLLPLTGLFFLFAVNIILNKKIEWYNYAGLITVGLSASLTKSAFLPVFAAGIVYILIFTYKNNRHNLLKNVVDSAKRSNKTLLGLWIAALTVLTVMFSGVYLKNIVLYKTPTPSCQAVLSMDRCLKSPIIQRDLNAANTKNQREPLSTPSFISEWIVSLNRQNGANFFSGSIKTAPDKFLTAIYLLTFISIGCILFAWRSLKKNAAWYFLLTMTLVLVLSLFFLNVSGYNRTHMILANQPRYLLSVVPIILMFTAASVNYILGKRQWIKIAIVLVILSILIQGGGILSYVSQGSKASYWDRKKVILLNEEMQKITRPLVENNW